jgi:hypothetical protein
MELGPPIGLLAKMEINLDEMESQERILFHLVIVA